MTKIAPSGGVPFTPAAQTTDASPPRSLSTSIVRIVASIATPEGALQVLDNMTDATSRLLGYYVNAREMPFLATVLSLTYTLAGRLRTREIRYFHLGIDLFFSKLTTGKKGDAGEGMTWESLPLRLLEAMLTPEDRMNALREHWSNSRYAPEDPAAEALTHLHDFKQQWETVAAFIRNPGEKLQQIVRNRIFCPGDIPFERSVGGLVTGAAASIAELTQLKSWVKAFSPAADALKAPLTGYCALIDDLIDVLTLLTALRSRAVLPPLITRLQDSAETALLTAGEGVTAAAAGGVVERGGAGLLRLAETVSTLPGTALLAEITESALAEAEKCAVTDRRFAAAEAGMFSLTGPRKEAPRLFGSEVIAGTIPDDTFWREADPDFSDVTFTPSPTTDVGCPDPEFQMHPYVMASWSPLWPGGGQILLEAGKCLVLMTEVEPGQSPVAGIHQPAGNVTATKTQGFPGGATSRIHHFTLSPGKYFTAEIIAAGNEPLLFELQPAPQGRLDFREIPDLRRRTEQEIPNRERGRVNRSLSPPAEQDAAERNVAQGQRKNVNVPHRGDGFSANVPRPGREHRDVKEPPPTVFSPAEGRIGRTLKSYPVNNRFSDTWLDDMRDSPREQMRERTSDLSEEGVLPAPQAGQPSSKSPQIFYPPHSKRQGVIHDGARSLTPQGMGKNQQESPNAALSPEQNVAQPPGVKDPDVPPGMQELFISPKDAPSCQARAALPETQGLNDMINQAILRLDHSLTLEERKKRVEKFAAGFYPPSSYLTPLDSIVTVCDKLIEDQGSRLNVELAKRFVAHLFEHAGFEYDPEFIPAFTRSPQGQGLLARVLLNVLDHSLPKKGILIKQIDNTFKTQLDPTKTTYAMLPGILNATLIKFTILLPTLLDMGGPSYEKPVELSQKVIYKLTSWVQKDLEYSWPFLKLRNSFALSHQLILDDKGIMRMIAIRMLPENNISDNELTQIGMHLLLGRDKEKLVEEYHHVDTLYQSSFIHQYMDYLERKTELLVRHLFLESKLRRLLNHSPNKEQDIRKIHAELRQNTLDLYALALDKLPSADRSILTSATGVKVRILRMEKITPEDTAHHTERFWFGFYLTAHPKNNINHGWFISALPASSDATQPLIFMASSDIFDPGSGAIISSKGRKILLGMLPESSISDRANYQFKADAERAISVSATGEWSLVASEIARQVADVQFPDITVSGTPATATSALSTGVDLLINLTPFGACRDVVDDLRHGHGVIITLLDAFKCLYSLVPGGAEEEVVVNILYRAAGSILNGVIGTFRTKKLHQQAFQLRAESVKEELEPGVVHDSRILYHLANSAIYRPALNKVLLRSSLNFTQLPGGFHLSSARLNIYSGEIYCILNTPYQQQHYKLDIHCQHLLPVSENIFAAQNMADESWVPLLVDPLKLACKSQNSLDAFIRQNVLEHRSGEIHFNSIERPSVPDDGKDIVLNNLDLAGVPADWTHQKTWVKKGCGIITEWKDAQEHIRFKQADVAGNWRVWHPTASNHTRTRRDVTTPPSLYTNVLNPIKEGFVELFPYNNPARKKALEEFKAAYTKIPEPPHAELMALRGFVRDELIPRLPSDFHWSSSLNWFSKGEKLDFNNFIRYAMQYMERARAQANVSEETLSFLLQLELKMVAISKLAEKIKNIDSALRTFFDLRERYFEKYIKPEQIALTPVNRIIYGIKNHFLSAGPDFYLKTRSEKELQSLYPEMYKRISEDLSELQRGAGALSLVLNKIENRPALIRFMSSFFGKTFSESDVDSFKNHINGYHEKLAGVRVSDFRLIEDRRPGKRYSQNLLPTGCLQSNFEKMIYGTGVIAFTNKSTGYKKIYLKSYLEDKDLLKSTMLHETIHTYLAPIHPLFRIGEEVYIDSGSLLHRFSFYGLNSMAAKLISNIKELQIHILSNRSELLAFCRQVYKMAGESDAVGLKEMIDNFWDNYLLNPNVHQYRQQSKERFDAFTPIMKSVYQNHEMMLGFVLANPDFLTGLWHSLLESTGAWPQPLSLPQVAGPSGITASRAMCLWVAGIDEYPGQHARPVD